MRSTLKHRGPGGWLENREPLHKQIISAHDRLPLTFGQKEVCLSLRRGTIVKRRRSKGTSWGGGAYSVCLLYRKLGKSLLTLSLIHLKNSISNFGLYCYTEYHVSSDISHQPSRSIGAQVIWRHCILDLFWLNFT